MFLDRTGLGLAVRCTTPSGRTVTRLSDNDVCTSDGSDGSDWFGSATEAGSATARDRNLSDVLQLSSEHEALGALAWAEGRGGAVMFSASDGSIRIGVGCRPERSRISPSPVWSENLSLLVLGGADVCYPFNVTSKATKRMYQLAYRVAALPGVFFLSRLVTVVPRCVVVNCKSY